MVSGASPGCDKDAAARWTHTATSSSGCTGQSSQQMEGSDTEMTWYGGTLK